MNVLHINSHDLLGSVFNGYYMLDSSNSDVNYEMLVWYRSSNNPKVHTLAPSSHFFRRLLEICHGLMLRIGIEGIFGYVTYQILKRKACFKKADIVHLHIIHNVPNFGILQLPKICKSKKIVWTIHDYWACSGGCICPMGCKGINEKCVRYCPHPRRIDSLLGNRAPYYLFRLKQNLYKRVNAHLVFSNTWFSTKAHASVLLKNHECSIIPFGLNPSLFKKYDSMEIRKKYSVPESSFVIAFRNLPIETDKFKGIKYTKEALIRLSSSGEGKNITILMIQNGHGFEELENEFNIIKLGVIDRKKLVEVYSMANVFLMPSLYETFGMMALEAMACETPTIVAKGTPLEEIVGHEECGLVVERENGQAIADAILRLKNNPQLAMQLGKNGRKKVLEQYTLEKCIQMHKELYSSLLNKTN